MHEEVEFTNSNGIALSGILSDAAPKDNLIVILCHGFRSTKNNKTIIDLQDILNKRSISTFAFDFYGHGESQGKLENITVSEGTDDILCAIEFLKQKGFSKIALFGSSFGGIASIMAASRSEDLQFLTLKCPVSDFKEMYDIIKTKQEMEQWKQKGYFYYVDSNNTKHKINYTFIQDFENNNGYEAAKKIKIPTLIVHGSEDKTVPVQQSIKTSKIIQNCTLEQIGGANHYFSNPKHFEKMIKIFVEYISDQN